MNRVTYVQARAAIHMVALGILVATHNFLSAVFFRVGPLVLGALMGFAALAQWRGWPV